MKFVFSMLWITWICLYSQTAHAGSENLTAALTDVAGKKICDRLQNRFRGLQHQTKDKEKAYIGTLWIHSCQITYDNNQQDTMTLDLGIKGWRWLNKEKGVLGADFSTDEFARFGVDVALKGQVVASYEPGTKRLAFWFKPTQSPEVEFKASGDVDVDKESLWGTALAGAATLIGQSPDTQADEKLASKGEQRFTDKMSEGFSAAIDFCSGRVYSSLGQPDKNTLFNKLSEQQKSAYESVDLAPSTFLLFGPYGEQSQSLELLLKQEKSEEFRSRLVCVEDAVTLAKAYMEGTDRTPEVPGIDTIRESSTDGAVSVGNKSENCPVVVMFAADKSVKKNALFQFKVQRYDENKPLAVCE